RNKRRTRCRAHNSRIRSRFWCTRGVMVSLYGAAARLVPPHRPPQPLLQPHPRTPPQQLMRTRRVQASPRDAVGLGGVPRDLAVVAGELADEFGEFFDRDFLTFAARRVGHTDAGADV